MNRQEKDVMLGTIRGGVGGGGGAIWGSFSGTESEEESEGCGKNSQLRQKHWSEVSEKRCRLPHGSPCAPGSAPLWSVRGEKHTGRAPQQMTACNESINTIQGRQIKKLALPLELFFFFFLLLFPVLQYNLLKSNQKVYTSFLLDLFSLSFFFPFFFKKKIYIYIHI